MEPFQGCFPLSGGEMGLMYTVPECDDEERKLDPIKDHRTPAIPILFVTMTEKVGDSLKIGDGLGLQVVYVE